jgi:hypothetical protein
MENSQFISEKMCINLDINELSEPPLHSETEEQKNSMPTLITT